MLSSGDEIGQVNDYNYKKNPDTAADSRYLHRSPFRWDNAEKRKKAFFILIYFNAQRGRKENFYVSNFNNFREGHKRS